MPYSGISDPSLPSNVRKLSATRKRQWLHVYNSAKADGVSDGEAIHRANGVIMRQMGRSMAKHDVAGSEPFDSELAADLALMVESGTEEFDQHCGYDSGSYALANPLKVDQPDADYDPYGAADGRGCATCRWFMSPNMCWVVAGDIAPSGLSRFYEPIPAPAEPSPIEVTLVDQDGSPFDFGRHEATPTSGSLLSGKAHGAYQNILQWLGLKRDLPADSGRSESALRLGNRANDPPGRMRYWAVASNNFMPDNKGKGFPTFSQQDYVDWVWQDPETRMAELQIWHTPGTRLGQDDWVDYDGHFLHSTGLIDAGREELAQRYADDPDIAMSHGYVVVWDEQDRASVFRSYERSVLPRKYAGNYYTSFGVEEGNVFTEPRKAFLRQAGYSDAEITARERRWDEFGKVLESLGIGSHELEAYVDSIRAEDTPPEGDPAAQPSSAPAAQPAPAPVGDPAQQPAPTPAAQPTAAQPAPSSTSTSQPAPAPVQAAAGTEAQAGMPTESVNLQQLATMIGSLIDQRNAPLVAAVQQLQANQQSFDERVAAEWTARAAGAGASGFRPAAASSTVPQVAQGENGRPTLVAGTQSGEIPSDPLNPQILRVIAQGAEDGEESAGDRDPVHWLEKRLVANGNPLLNGGSTEHRVRG